VPPAHAGVADRIARDAERQLDRAVGELHVLGAAAA
jgi:hypothetical protein